MKDGRTHLAHKAEHAVDMETGAVLAVRVSSAIAGDTQTVGELFDEVVENLIAVMEDPQATEQLSEQLAKEVVGDKGFHSNRVLGDLHELGARTYISEPDRGRRNWKGKAAARDVTYGNRRRIRRAKGTGLLRRRGEVLERGFALHYPQGGMRRTQLRRHSNILKRLLVHVAAGNLGLAMRRTYRAGTPRGLKALSAAVLIRHWRLVAPLCGFDCCNERFKGLLSRTSLYSPIPAPPS